MGSENRLRRVLQRLENGADIGCKGPSRLPTIENNSRSFFEYGVRVADSLQGWITDGLCFGPAREEELPWIDHTVNPMTVKLKPNGKARICINMSAPMNTNPESGEPSSVNSGIDPEEFPATMSSTKSFCQSLMRAGCPAEVCKLDWNQAYKHIAVRSEDHKLQVIEFGGRYFGEVMLTFGCSSSAGIYDDAAKLVKEMAEKDSGMDNRMTNQVLDDAVGVGKKGNEAI